MKKIFALFALLAMVTQAVAQSGQLPSPNWQPGTAARNLGFNPLNPANNLSEITNAAQARVNLGLYTAGLNNDNIVNYGASGSSQSTTGTMVAGANTVTVASTIDFAIGQGVRVMGAGPSNLPTAPGINSVTVQGTPGTTAYNYFICSLGYNGSISTCVSAGTNTGPDPVTANGLTYYGSTNNYVQINLLLSGNTSGHVIYRGINGGALTLWTVGFGNTFKDQGLGWTSNGTASGTWNGPNYFPTSYPTTAVNDWFVGNITAINGNQLTLVPQIGGIPTTASNSVVNAAVYHDDTASFNAAVLANSSKGSNIQVPCGTFNVSANINILANNVGFSGQGMCSNINVYGANTLFQLRNNSVSSQQRSNFLQNLYITEYNQSSGFILYGTNLFNFTLSNVQADHPPYGFFFQNTNTVNAFDDYIFSGTRGWASNGFMMTSDSTNYTCCLNAFNFYIHGNAVYTGNTANSIGGKDKNGFVFDGNTATIYSIFMADSDIEGSGFLIVNDTGNASSPYYLTFLSASCEFPTDRCVSIFGPGGISGPGDVYFTDTTLTGAQNGAPVFVVDSTSARITFKGGKIANGSCRGADISGTQVTITGAMIGNNSTATAGACDGIVVESAARGTVITGNQIGDPYNATVQRYPVFMSNGTDYFNVSGNTLYGNVTNCVQNGGSTAVSRIIANNAGSC